MTQKKKKTRRKKDRETGLIGTLAQEGRNDKENWNQPPKGLRQGKGDLD